MRPLIRMGKMEFLALLEKSASFVQKTVYKRNIKRKSVPGRYITNTKTKLFYILFYMKFYLTYDVAAFIYIVNRAQTKRKCFACAA